MDCYICGKEYKSWQGLFYHKRKVHNCVDVRSSRYEYEIKNAAKFAEDKARKEAMEEHHRKKYKEDSTRIKCKLCCRDCREEIFKDYIKQQNIYSKNEYYMKPEKLKDLLNTERYDVILITLEFFKPRPMISIEYVYVYM